MAPHPCLGCSCCCWSFPWLRTWMCPYRWANSKHQPCCDKVKLKDFKIKTMILRWYHQNMYIYIIYGMISMINSEWFQHFACSSFQDDDKKQELDPDCTTKGYRSLGYNCWDVCYPSVAANRCKSCVINYIWYRIYSMLYENAIIFLAVPSNRFVSLSLKLESNRFLLKITALRAPVACPTGVWKVSCGPWILRELRSSERYFEHQNRQNHRVDLC